MTIPPSLNTVIISLALVCSGFGQDERIWTNKDGRTTRATFVRLDRDSDLVTIKKGDREFHIPFESLVDADKDYAERQEIESKRSDSVRRRRKES